MGTRGRARVGVAFALIVCLCTLALATPAQPTLRWRDIRGTNYIPASSTADNNIQMWLPHATAQGTFDPKLVDAELAALAAHGVNSIRVFGSFWAFVAAPARYERDLRHLLDACRRHRLRMTFIVWDAFGRDGPATAATRSPDAPCGEILACVSRTRQTLRRVNPTMPATMGGFWFASPGRKHHAAHPSPTTWDKPLADRANRYLDRLADLFGGAYADVFHAYDLYNEPENLLLVRGMTYRTLVQISADLCHYTLARLGRTQASPAYTVGAAFINTCYDLDRELVRRGAPRMSYLSYHDYDDPASCLHRAAIARYHGVVSGRDVVCSEFHQAARQGGLWPMLSALQQMRIGGQIWDFLQDRVFVVELPELEKLLGGRDRCWFHESGLIRPVADARRPGSYRFEPIDPIKCTAYRAWAADLALPPFVGPNVTVTRTPHTLPARYCLTVTGLADQPAWLFVAPPGAARARLPGLGTVILDSRTRVVPLGALAAAPGHPDVGTWRQEVLPIAHPVVDVEIQALVGADYDPRIWQRSRVTALSPIIRVRL